MTRLMHIPVSGNWRVAHHSFFDEDPVFSDGVCTNLTEDLLQLHHGSDIIDVGFYRDRYRMIRIRDADWEHPVRQQDCTTRHEVLDVIEQWTANVA